MNLFNFILRLVGLAFVRGELVSVHEKGIILAASAIAAGATAYAADSSRKSANRANDANARNTADTNAANRAMFDLSRGSEGSAVLPIYMKDQEAGLGSKAALSAEAGLNYGGGAAGRMATATQTLGGYVPMINSGNDYITSLYNGGLLAQRRGSLQGVLDARTASATDAANAIDQSIYGQIGRLDADGARRGFFGGSTFDRNRTFMAALGAKLNASQMVSQARLQNAQDVYGLNESDVGMRASMLDQPFSRASQQLSLQYAPMESESRATSNAMAPLSFFRLGQQAFQYQAPPVVQPNINGGMIAGSAIAQGANAFGNAYANRQLMNSMQQAQQQQQLSNYYNSSQFGANIGAQINSGGSSVNTGGMYA